MNKIDEKNLIDKKSVYTIVDDLITGTRGTAREKLKSVKFRVSCLPSTQTIVGHWVEIVESWSDGNVANVYYKCSECGEYGYDDMNFCPNCGCKMIVGE